MKKRFGFLSLFAVTAVLLAVVGAVAALAAPSADNVTGTIELDQDWYNDTGTVVITVTDADANISTPQTNQVVVVGVDALDIGQFVQLNAFPISGTPVVAINPGGAEHPASVANTVVINADLGRILLFVDGGTVNNGDTIDIVYSTSAQDSVDVTVVSTQDSTGITVSATETNNDSGVFEVIITLANTSSAGSKLLSVLDLNTVTASYVDDTPGSGSGAITVKAEAQVETGKPTFANLSPVDGFSTQATQPVLSGIINDVGGAGLDISTIVLLIDLDANGTFDGGTEAQTPAIIGDDGDTTATFTFTPPVLSPDNHIWQIQATDLAGNVGASDSDDSEESPGDDPHLLSIDLSPPAMLTAETGTYWDSDAEEEAFNKLDRLVIKFDEKVDANSVSAADFTVEGLSPIVAEVVSDEPNNVYLTLGADMAADDEPVVAIASGGSISDKAGNSLNVGQLDADDMIAPTFTVTLDTTLTNDEVIITISSNERISGVPSVTVHNNVDLNEDNVADASKTLSIIVKTSTSWESTFTAPSTPDAYEGDGSVVVTASDLKNNAGTKGDGTIDDDGNFSSKAIVFTQDVTDPVVTFDPANDGTVFSAAPFITVTFDGKVTVDEALFGPADGDLSDILAAGDMSSDQKTFIYKASGLTVGEDYTIQLTVTDLAGNEAAEEAATFSVDEKPVEEIALVPGSNLVSLSGDPADSDINAVITLAEVSSVITYDPLNPDPITGPWKTATRDSSGNLSGSLSTFDAQHAYWVSTSSFEPIEVEVQQQGLAQLPPSIGLVGGWNLVPVVNVSGAGADVDGGTVGIQLNADSYFGSTSWVTAYTWDTKNELWLKTLPGTFSQVTVGKGYWLYVTGPGILVP